MVHIETSATPVIEADDNPPDPAMRLTDLDLAERGTPVTFAGCAGFLHAAQSRRAILVLSPWGTEAIFLYRTFRALAAAAARSGFPALRFDYTSSGNALDVDGSTESVSAWAHCAIQAVRFLEQTLDIEHITVMAYGSAALGVPALAASTPRIDSAILLEPAIRGRDYIREAISLERIFRERTDLPEARPDESGALSVAGITMSPALRRDLETVDIAAAPIAGLRHVLLATRHPGKQVQRLLSQFDLAGCEVATTDFPGFEQMYADPTASIPPAKLIRTVADWLTTTFGSVHTMPFVAPAALPSPARQSGDGFEEELFFFSGDRLFGVYCAPPEPPVAAVLFLNIGRNHTVGWARSTTEQARSLAAAGIASLRFDVSTVGDSLDADPDNPRREILYSEDSVGDVTSALDELERRVGTCRIVLSGGCSGAFLAFAAAYRDRRVGGIVMVNPQRFVWDETEKVGEALRQGVRTMRGMSDQTMQWRQWKRLLRGEINVRPIIGRLISHFSALCGAAMARRGVYLGRHARITAEIRRRFAELGDRGVSVTLVMSEFDRAREEFANHVGDVRQGLKLNPRFRTLLLRRADHNVTPRESREAVLAEIRRAALETGLS